MKVTTEGRERRQPFSDAMEEFIEGWVINDLCRRFRTLVDATYSETFEFQLLRVLVDDPCPQPLQLIASRCGASRTLVLPDGRLRRALERLERVGLVVRTGAGEKPRYSLNRGDPTCLLLERLYAGSRQHRLVSASLAQTLGSHPTE